MENNNNFDQFAQIIEENDMQALGTQELFTRLRQAEAGANNLFAILGILAARTGGRLEFTAEEWSRVPTYKEVTFGQDLETDQVVIEFNE